VRQTRAIITSLLHSYDDPVLKNSSHCTICSYHSGVDEDSCFAGCDAVPVCT
jgi:hypothetical protein